jgi:hypothetical protein
MQKNTLNIDFVDKIIFSKCIMPAKMSMQITGVSRVLRGKRHPVHTTTPSMPVINQGRVNRIGDMGMINRVRYAPSGCGSCGGR